jgi:hypothetical protein
MKRCPFCAEDIRAAAIICRFCNRELPAPAETEAADQVTPTPRTPSWLASSADEPCPVCGRTMPPGAAEVLRAVTLGPAARAPSAERASDWRAWALGIGIIVVIVAGSLWITLNRRSGTAAQPDSPARTDSVSGRNPAQSVPEPDASRQPSIVPRGEGSPAESAVRAEDLVAAYTRNEIAADRLYKGRVIDIAGPVGWVGTDVFGTPYVTLGRDATTNVQARFPRGSETMLADLSPDQPIVVRCRIEGKLVSVAARDCQLR